MVARLRSLYIFLMFPSIPYTTDAREARPSHLHAWFAFEEFAGLGRLQKVFASVVSMVLPV